jgi:hypothetical protein
MPADLHRDDCLIYKSAVQALLDDHKALGRLARERLPEAALPRSPAYVVEK